MKYKSPFVKLKDMHSGFTLIELLVVISIIGVLMALSIFGLQGAREASRDSKRKADLEQIRSALEIYKADCDKYPVGTGNVSSILNTSGGQLKGDGTTASCSTNNVYLSQIPQDSNSPDRNYIYFSDGIVYQVCLALEGITGTVSCGGVSSCGTTSCNYLVKNP